MTELRKLHELWMEQCEAAGAIKEPVDPKQTPVHHKSRRSR